MNLRIARWSRLTQIAWFFGIWLASVITLAVIVLLLRQVMSWL